MSHVGCHMSGVRCQVSIVSCHMLDLSFNFFLDKDVELVGGGSGINGA